MSAAVPNLHESNQSSSAYDTTATAQEVGLSMLTVAAASGWKGGGEMGGESATESESHGTGMLQFWEQQLLHLKTCH